MEASLKYKKYRPMAAARVWNSLNWFHFNMEPQFKRKFIYDRGDLRRSKSVEILTTAAQLVEKSHCKGLQ